MEVGFSEEKPVALLGLAGGVEFRSSGGPEFRHVSLVSIHINVVSPVGCGMPDNACPFWVGPRWDGLTGVDMVLVKRDLVSICFGQLGDRGEVFAEVFG